MIIGTFKPVSAGSFSGSIHSLGFSHPRVSIKRQGKAGKGPDFTIWTHPADCDPVEIGAAWERTSRAENSYLSVKLDGPGMAEPISAALVSMPEDSDMLLVWDRSAKKK